MEEKSIDVNEKKEKYLPIGSVVLLKGGTKKAMITGFCSVDQENEDEIFDYSGCVYPEGYLSSNQVCLFNHDQISKIYHVGYENDEEKEFKTKLTRIIETIEKEKKSKNSYDYSNTPKDINVKLPNEE